MLFTPESILAVRRALFAQMQAGTLTREQLFQRALELDAFDAVSLIAMAQERFQAGDMPGAAEYCWRAASADPCRCEPWFKLAACLSGESQDLRNGVMELGARKALRDPKGLDQFKESFKSKPLAAHFTDGEEFLEVTAGQFGAMRSDEPEEVGQRLRPYRLVDDLLEDAEAGLAPELVDGIIADGARCGPMLIGVLRALATESLPGGDPAPVVASLALLGEIGDPAVLPELIECYTVDDEDIEDAAHWAVKRIAARRPEAPLDAVRRLVSTADAEQRCALAMVVGDVPPQPGKRDVLLSLLDGLAEFQNSERIELFIAVAIALSISEGAKGRELAWSLLSRYAAVLPKQTRADLREVCKLQEELLRIAPPQGDGAGMTVYDICGEAWEDDEDGDSVPAPVRRTVTPGRNDPCWCGSGKKYKKCHLESDEKSRRAPSRPEEG